MLPINLVFIVAGVVKFSAGSTTEPANTTEVSVFPNLKIVYILSVYHVYPTNTDEVFSYQLHLENTEHKSTIKRVLGRNDTNSLTKDSVFLFHKNLRLMHGYIVDYENNPNNKPFDIGIESSGFKIEFIKRTKIEIYAPQFFEKCVLNILNELECPVCLVTMQIPILQCTNGHGICRSCRLQMPTCPICSAAFIETRNLIAEKTSAYLMKRCKYANKQCPHVSPLVDLKKHEEECSFGDITCPFKNSIACDWKGKSYDLMNHMRSQHAENVINSDTVNMPMNTDLVPYNKCFILERCGEIFKLVHKYQEEHLIWQVQLISLIGACNKYKYVLHIKDNMDEECTLSFKRSCSAMTMTNHLEENTYVKVPLDLVKPMCGERLIYTITIKMENKT